MTPRHTVTDHLLSLLLVACVLGIVAIVLSAAYKAGYRDAEMKHVRGGTGRISQQEIEGRAR